MFVIELFYLIFIGLNHGFSIGVQMYTVNVYNAERYIFLQKSRARLKSA